jgi:hypothetical protein
MLRRQIYRSDLQIVSLEKIVKRDAVKFSEENRPIVPACIRPVQPLKPEAVVMRPVGSTGFETEVVTCP